MNLIEFFGTVIKPKKTKGRGLWAPSENIKLNDNLFIIRDKDVNMFLIKSNNGYIAIDSGYKNSLNIIKGLEELNINPDDVTTVLLTHIDLDHAGGVDSRCNNIFKNAKVYLSKEESKYLTRKLFRKKILFINLASPIKLREGYELLENNQNIIIDGIEIQTLSTPGHTLGHMSYLIDKKILFVGDTLIIGEDGGYCFMDFWNQNSSINKESLNKQYLLSKENNIELILTSHSGVTSDIEFAFKNINTTPDWKKKGFVLRKDAPYNPFK
ncbi:MAG: MBL fold metallo-hydrolase [bacterium]